MEYLRAIINSDARGSLYKKDFEVQKVFDVYIRTYMSTLINAGVVYEGELYSALIMPRYGRFKRTRPKITFEDKERDKNQEEKKQRRWIALTLEQPIQPDRPIDYFTLEVRMADRPLIYRDDIPLYDIEYFWRSIERTLTQINVLGYQEQHRRNLFARDDEQFDFDREELYTWQEEADELIEMVPQDETDEQVIAASSFPRKALKDFPIVGTKALLLGKLVDDTPEHAKETGEARPSEVQILITRSALESMQHIARNYVRVEMGGMLIGHIYENVDNPGYIVEITDHVLSEGALASEIELRITFEAWQRQTTLLKERYPGKRIVGWYHTHLDLVKKAFYTDESRRSMYTSALFFSQDDLFTHRQFFREKWYVAMVLDSDGNLVFFQWEGNEIPTAERFYIIESEMGVAQTSYEAGSEVKGE